MTIHHPTLFIFILTGETTTCLQASLGKKGNKKKKEKKEKKDVSTILFSGCARLYKLYACILDKKEKKKKLIEREKQKVTRETRIEKTEGEKKNIYERKMKKKKLCSE